MYCLLKFMYRMYKQEDLLPEKYFMTSAEIDRTWSMKSEVTEKIAIWKHFLNKTKEERKERAGKNSRQCCEGIVVLQLPGQVFFFSGKVRGLICGG